jgi:uncharacterized protein (TIGR00299 family) protein
MRLAWFDCFSGISGDMTLGALIGAGWASADLESLPRRLKLEGVAVAISMVRRGAFAATRVEVKVETARQPHRHLHHIAAMLEAGELDAEVRARALAVFRRLAEAEAKVHGSTVEKVHFHEVGAADALVDIVGAVEGLRALGVRRVFSSPPKLGRGTVESEHGTIPVPAPATALLLEGAPVEIGDIEAELTTPTGAALLATLVEDWGAPPPFVTRAIGVGAGGRDLKQQANVLRMLLGDAREAAWTTRRVTVLETAVDDENPQYVAALIPDLLAAGALDAMVVPNLMKKGRAGLWIVALAEPDRAEAIAELLLSRTTSLGVRVREEQRLELPRRAEEVETAFGRIAIKVARLPDGTERAIPEFESVRAAASGANAPLRDVAAAALDAWRGRPRGAGGC